MLAPSPAEPAAHVAPPSGVTMIDSTRGVIVLRPAC
jgi:hypothetical protein